MEKKIREFHSGMSSLVGVVGVHLDVVVSVHFSSRAFLD